MKTPGCPDRTLMQICIRTLSVGWAALRQDAGSGLKHLPQCLALYWALWQRDPRETISHMDSKYLPKHLGTQTFTGETLIPDYIYNQEGS